MFLCLMAIQHSHILKPLLLQRRQINSWALKAALELPQEHTNAITNGPTGSAAPGRASVTNPARKGLEIPSGGGKVSSERKASAAQRSRGLGAWLLLSLLSPLTLQRAPRLIPRERRRAGEPQFKVQSDLASSTPAFFYKKLIFL